MGGEELGAYMEEPKRICGEGGTVMVVGGVGVLTGSGVVEES